MKIYKFRYLTKNDYENIAALLINGGIIIYPTETIYGIGCNINNQSAVDKIYEIKGRNVDKYFSALFRNIEMLESYVNINKRERDLIDKYWPGEVTLILNKKESGKTLGCRISPHDFLFHIFQYIDFPIVSTSANLSGLDYQGGIDEILNIFKDKVDAVIDAGNLPNNIPSTVVKVRDNKIEILREGKLKLDID